jgi:hypothetical protein
MLTAMRRAPSRVSSLSQLGGPVVSRLIMFYDRARVLALSVAAAAAPQPDHDIHDDAPHEALRHIIVLAKDCV